jgi:hypothetical protein
MYFQENFNQATYFEGSWSSSSPISSYKTKHTNAFHVFINRVKTNQLDEQHILSIFREPLYVSGVSRPIIRRMD